MIFGNMPAIPMVFLGGYSLDFTGSTLLLIVLLVLGLAWPIIAYRRTTPPTSIGLRLLLGFLRALALILLVMLIFEPSLSRHRTQKLKPLLSIIFDDTQSMAMQDASVNGRQQLKRLMEDPAWKSLSQKFDLEVFAAGDSLRKMPGLVFDSLQLRTIGTDLAGSWQRVLARKKGNQYAAIVLISDGGNNAGRNPRQAAQETSTPLYTLGIGDTSAIQDASIASISAGEVAYRGKLTQITVGIRSKGLAGQAARLELVGPQGQIYARQYMQLPPDQLETEALLSFTPSAAGLLPLHLQLVIAATEGNDNNNARDFPLEVLENRLKVLVVNGLPGYESMFFLREASSLAEVEINSVTFRPDGSIFGGRPDQLGIQMSLADVLVLMDFPQKNSSSAAQERLKRAYTSHPLPLWAWMGTHPFPDGLRNLCGEVPFSLGRDPSGGEVEAVPERYYSEVNPDAETSELNLWADLPPLEPPMTIIQGQNSARSLINLKDSENGNDCGPALLVWENNGRRYAASFGSGYWRWNFLTLGLEGSNELYRSYLNAMLRWLAASPQLQPLRISTDRRLYSSGEAVKFAAQMLGGQGRLITSAQVEVELRGPEGYSHLLLEPTTTGQYAGSFSPEEVGVYTYRGYARVAEDTLAADSGSFMVEAYNVEKETLRQDRELLQAIAQASGGKYFPADSLIALGNAIPAEPRLVSSGWNRRFFLNWDVWGLLIALLTLEWFIRKRKGML